MTFWLLASGLWPLVFARAWAETELEYEVYEIDDEGMRFFYDVDHWFSSKKARAKPDGVMDRFTFS